MSEPSTDYRTTPNNAHGLWWVCVIVIAAVLTAWSAARWKPVGWFPSAYGAVLGLIAALLSNWVHAAPHRGRSTGLMIVAAVGASLSLMMAAQLQMRRENAQLTGLAAEMVKTHEQLTGGGDTARDSPPWLNLSTKLHGYLESRYGRRSESVLAAAVVLEAAVAAGAAWAASRLLLTAAPALERRTQA